MRPDLALLVARLLAAVRHRAPRGDAGSLLPMILVFVMIVVLFIMGMMTSTSAFLAQRALQGTCDSAALWAASEVSSNDVLDDAGTAEVLPLSPEAVAAAVEDHLTRFYPDDSELQMTATTDGEVLTVACRTKEKVPFGAAFGKGDGIERNASSSVRSPISEPTPEARIITEEELDQMQDNDENP